MAGIRITLRTTEAERHQTPVRANLANAQDAVDLAWVRLKKGRRRAGYAMITRRA